MNQFFNKLLNINCCVWLIFSLYYREISDFFNLVLRFRTAAREFSGCLSTE